MKEKLAEDTRSYQRKTNRTTKTTKCWECYFGLQRSIFKTNQKKKKKGICWSPLLWKVSVGWCLGWAFCRQPYCREWLGGDRSEAKNGPLIVTLQAHGKPLKLYLMVANPMISQLLHPCELFYNMISLSDFFFYSANASPLSPTNAFQPIYAMDDTRCEKSIPGLRK